MRQTGVGGSPSISSTLAPETPSASASQNAPTPVPIELTTPTPVTSTLRSMRWSLPDAAPPRDGCGDVPRTWVYAETNHRKLPGVSSTIGALAPPEFSSLHPMSTARRRRRGDRPPALGEDGLHADPTRNGLTAPEEIGAARSLVHAYRTHGHMAARLDPLGSDPIGDPALDPAYHGLADDALERIPAAALDLFVPGETLADALPRLRETYAGPIAYQIEHLSGHRQRLWLREAIESGAYTQPLPPDERRHILDRLLRVETFEHYLHRAFLGEKQFSIEGLDVMVLMLDEMIMLAAQAGIAEAVLGMAHRGRLNVLAHVLRRNYSSIISEFEGRPGDDILEVLPVGGAGDVKYHHGARSSRAIDVVVREAGEVRVEQRRIDISLLPNPSHLEFVNPVVSGRVRALQTDQERSDAPADTSRALAISIHGDAAFPGQGVVAETLNLQSLAGYRVGGTLHVIANNQVGFTTDAHDSRSTRYSSDLAKGFDIPIIHVNADAVDACRSAVRLAMAFRERFGRDVLIDLVGYRRFGHNETDEPSYTQPLQVERIKAHPSVVSLYAQRLIDDGLTDEAAVEARRAQMLEQLSRAHHPAEAGEQAEREPGERMARDLDQVDAHAPTADELIALSDELLELPEGFTVHPKLGPQLERRRTAVREGGIDWGHAEALAFGSLLNDGIAIRMTGQDTERGTFSHRHLVLHDVHTGERYTPMQHLADSKARFEVHNSPLSEAACLGFEYGYSVTRRNALVDLGGAVRRLRERRAGADRPVHRVRPLQVGRDLAAHAVPAARLRGQRPRALLGAARALPAARRRRQPAHRQRDDPGPAVPPAAPPGRRPHPPPARRHDAEGPAAAQGVAVVARRLHRRRVPADHRRPGQRRVARGHQPPRALLRPPLLRHPAPRRARDADEVAIARIEQLYPFPTAELTELLAGYTGLKEIVWAQEEPANMGAWRSVRHRVEAAVPPGVRLSYAGRPWRGSPSEGYTSAHYREQDRIVRAALGLPLPPA